MNNKTISIYSKSFIDIFRIDKVVGTSYDRENKVFTIFTDDYSFSYRLNNFKNNEDFINTINNVNRNIKNYNMEDGNV